jgi:hypothetical protein
MNTPKTTPKDFFLWAGAMITLYGSAIAFINLIFDYINYAFPNSLSFGYYNPYQGSVSFEIASLLVLFPVFLVLMRLIRKDIIHDSSRRDIWVRRWALYLTLFVAGATVMGDLITLIYTFLSGEELTTRFLLKVVVVLLVAGGGFLHFMADLWGYWIQYPSRARSVGWGVGALILISIFAGFFIIGSPWQARQYRIDEQRVNDLQNIQSQITTYWQQKQKLPAALNDLKDPLASYQTVPNDPTTGQPYEYQITGPMSFKLCADFSMNSRDIGGRGQVLTRPVEYGVIDNWQHGVGHQCFDRPIDPDRYPPLPKPTR